MAAAEEAEEALEASAQRLKAGVRTQVPLRARRRHMCTRPRGEIYARRLPIRARVLCM